MCGANRLSTFALAGTASPCRTRRVAWAMARSTRGSTGSIWSANRWPCAAPSGSQCRADVHRLPLARLGKVAALGIRTLQLLGGLLALAPRDAVALLGQAGGRYGSGCGRPAPRQIRRAVEHPAGPAQQAADDAHAVAKGRAVGRVPDGRLDHRAVDARFPPARDPRGLGQGDRPVVERRHRLRRDAGGPADGGWCRPARAAARRGSTAAPPGCRSRNARPRRRSSRTVAARAAAGG